MCAHCYSQAGATKFERCGDLACCPSPKGVVEAKDKTGLTPLDLYNHFYLEKDAPLRISVPVQGDCENTRLIVKAFWDENQQAIVLFEKDRE